MYSSVDDALSPVALSGHIPVLLNETLELMVPRAGAKFLEHSAEFLRRGACLCQVSSAPACLFARPVLAHLLMVHYAQPRGPFVPHGPLGLVCRPL